jgi:hypothetical protein
LTVEVWGGGGGGGTGGNAAGGGGGGAYARSQFINVAAGNYTVVVGAAGIGAGTNITGAGGASSFSGTGITTVTAVGGTRGGDDFGGAGGLAGSSGNEANFSGGNGGNRNGGGGGGGGSSASSISDGNNGGNGTGAGAGGAGGVLTGAGSGGRGSDRDGTPDADPGAQPGGGGGARGRDDNVSTSKNGGVGRVVVTVSNVLPITLVSFQARSEEGGAMITWKVSAEINNEKMLVQRSKDGLNFQEIGQVKGRGTTNVPFEYHFFDANPGGGETYYRLKQLDFNGKFEYSKIIVLNTEGFIRLFIYPNPARERVFVKTTQDVIDLGLHLYDALGRKHNLQWTGGAGLYEATLPSQLTPGLYLISDPKGENKGKLLVQ